MKISIYGMGYVGVVSAGCLARMGHQVVGVDINPDKISILAGG
jgi:GDP-mannose 6-dehydrogenase